MTQYPRTLCIAPWYNLETQKNLSIQQKKYPLHHLWGYDQLENAFSLNVANGLIERIGNLFGIVNLRQQLWALLHRNKYDQIYFPIIESSLLLAFLKRIKVFNKRMIGLSHHSMQGSPKGLFRRLTHSIRKSLYMNGVDEVVFLNETIYNHANEHSKNHKFISSWGVDIDSFPKDQESSRQRSDYYFCTGKTNRDFQSITNAFSNLTSNLLIQTTRFQNTYSTPPNIKIDDRTSLTDADLIESYLNSRAVLIPLLRQEDFPTGITVIFEAFCFSKPVISTKNSHYPFDLEKEGVGLLVDYGDQEGWENAVRWMDNHPEKVAEMGQKGRTLIETRYNYQNFCAELKAILHNEFIAHTHD